MQLPYKNYRKSTTQRLPRHGPLKIATSAEHLELTLGFSRGTSHNRHLDALRVVNYGVEGMGLPNKEDRRSIGPGVAEIEASQKRFRPGRAAHTEIFPLY